MSEVIATGVTMGVSPLRRRILLGGAGLLASKLAIPSWAQSEPQMANDFWLRPRTLSMRHTSGDRIQALYWSDGQVVREGYEELSWFLRDRVDGAAVYVDPILLDIGFAIGGWLAFFDLDPTLVLTSGHRTKRRNSVIEGAAKDSEHIKGKAMDVRIPGVNSSQVAAFGRWLQGGGIGWYPGKNFTHLDTGRLRFWKG